MRRRYASFPIGLTFLFTAIGVLGFYLASIPAPLEPPTASDYTAPFVWDSGFLSVKPANTGRARVAGAVAAAQVSSAALCDQPDHVLFTCQLELDKSTFSICSQPTDGGTLTQMRVGAATGWTGYPSDAAAGSGQLVYNRIEVAEGRAETVQYAGNGVQITVYDVVQNFVGFEAPQPHFRDVGVQFSTSVAQRCVAPQESLGRLNGIVVSQISAASHPLATVEIERQSTGLVHTVRQLDTLYRLGHAYGTTFEAIAAANGLANPNLLTPGQQLRIPAGNNTVVDPTIGQGGVPTNTLLPQVPRLTGTQYTVQPGDYLRIIGAWHLVDWRDIASLNGIPAPYIIYPEQQLNLPPRN